MNLEVNILSKLIQKQNNQMSLFTYKWEHNIVYIWTQEGTNRHQGLIGIKGCDDREDCLDTMLIFWVIK